MLKRDYATPLRRLAAATCLVAVAACDGGDTKRVGQTLATVNGAAITVHQVNAELSDMAGRTGAKPAELHQRALEKVVERELLAAQAVQAKLDRDPAVMMALERGRSQVLAHAYLQSQASAATPTKVEIDDYIDKHPQLFSQRKVYDLRYLALPSSSMNGDVAAMVDRAASLDELAALLGAGKIAFSRGQSYRSSTELPEPVLASIDVVTKRPTFVMRDRERTLLASLSYVREDPVTGVQARQQVAQFLSNRNSLKSVSDQVARLRRAATIDYPKAGAASAAQNAPAAPPANDISGTAASPIESGVAGLQ